MLASIAGTGVSVSQLLPSARFLMFPLENISINVMRNRSESEFGEGMAPSALWSWCECGFLMLPEPVPGM